MWNSRKTQQQQFLEALDACHVETGLLLGLTSPARTTSLSWQMVASCRRIDYIKHRLARDISPNRADPKSPSFDPELASEYFRRNGNVDEAIWVAFLSAHFGKHRRYGWARVAFIYSGDGSGNWTWQRLSTDIAGFRQWLSGVEDHVPGGFSNHRKYESVGAWNANGTGAVFEDFLRFIGPGNSPTARLAGLVVDGGNNPGAAFDHFYKHFDVHRFGRLGKFDLFTLLNALNLAPLEPGSAYLSGATGPSSGAKLLFANNPTAAICPRELQDKLDEVDVRCPVGMHVWEDALCNWQKCPNAFKHFKG